MNKESIMTKSKIAKRLARSKSKRKQSNIAKNNLRKRVAEEPVKMPKFGKHSHGQNQRNAIGKNRRILESFKSWFTGDNKDGV